MRAQSSGALHLLVFQHQSYFLEKPDEPDLAPMRPKPSRSNGQPSRPESRSQLNGCEALKSANFMGVLWSSYDLMASSRGEGTLFPSHQTP
jgi:hypothetical protein